MNNCECLLNGLFFFLLFVPEDEEGLFPFRLQDVTNVRIKAGFSQPKKKGLHIKNFNAWTYQQLLKIYSPIVLSTVSTKYKRPKILPTVLIVDADTVFVKRTSFIRLDNQYWYSISSVRTGAFPSDTKIGSDHFKNLPGLNELLGNVNQCDGKASVLTKLLMSGNVDNVGLINRGRDEHFTSITHHSIFQKDVIELLLHRLQNQTCGFKCSSYHNCPWERLATVKPFVSEYELYLSFAGRYFPDRLALRSLSYVNAGLQYANPYLNQTDLGNDHYHRPVTYVTMHDDYGEWFGCCVNMSPTCQAPKDKRLQCDDNGTKVYSESKCQHVGCCYDTATAACFHIECGPCNSRYRVSEISEAVLRLKGCSRLYFPEHTTRSSYINSRQGKDEARKNLIMYVKCIRDGKVLED